MKIPHPVTIVTVAVCLAALYVAALIVADRYAASPANGIGGAGRGGG